MLTWEYITIVGQYNSLQFKEQIDPRLLERGYTEKQMEALKKATKQTPKEIISLNLKFTGLLTDYEYPYFDYIMILFEQYKLGTMPFPGSPTQQPSKIIEIFSVLEQLKYELEDRMRKEQEQKRTREELRNRRGRRKN